MDIINLEQQLWTIVQLSERVEESLCGTPWLHRHPEEKGYWYLLNTGLWFLNFGMIWPLLSMTL